MGAIRRLYRWLVHRLPPRPAWVVWRVGVQARARRRARVQGPEVALARVIWGISKEEELAPLVERLVAESGAAASDVLVVSDCDAVHVAAARGCRLEYLPEREGWLRTFPDGDYERFLEARGRGIRAAYRIARLELPGGTPTALSRGLGEEPG